MDSGKWQKIEEAVAVAPEISGGRRGVWLDEFCAGDAELKAQIQSLLALSTEAENFLEKSVSPYAAQILPENGTNLAGKQFSHYKIVAEIGRGGMGAVFLAERSDGEFEQRVALKIMRQTILDSEAENRFRRERQILAKLNHLNIARLLDGGVSASGEPFLVMEYIEGKPVVEFAEKKSISIQQRLKLFLQICSAVAFAHRNLIIHRDIKPSNILVAADGNLKLLDFGLAKILEFENDLTQTATAFRAFTPAYASPEQLRGEQVTTASDVYSLGIVLYELLTGARPFNFQGKSLEQIIKTVSRAEPTRPSGAETRGRGDAERQNQSSSNISASQLKGDLDNIILKALRIEPERRYKSVEAFAEDIERHLKGLPVHARPQTFAYRASKFIQRNKIAVAASILIFASLIGGIVMTVWQARRTAEQAAIAEQEARAAQAEREKAEQALIRAEKSKKFLRDMLSYANPAWYSRSAGKKDVTILEAVNDAGSRIDTEFADFPEVRADLHFTLGEIYNMVRYENPTEYAARREKAHLHLAECLRLRRELYGEENAQTAEAYYLYAGMQSPDLDAEIFYLRKSLEIFRNTAPDNANVPYLLMDLGGNLGKKNEFDEAESLNQEALEILRRKNGEKPLTVAFPLMNLGKIALRRGQPDKAEIILKQALEIAGTQDKRTTLDILISLKEVYEARGDKAKAAEIKLEIARLEQK